MEGRERLGGEKAGLQLYDLPAPYTYVEPADSLIFLFCKATMFDVWSQII